jgi:hypothetical protein
MVGRSFADRFRSAVLPLFKSSPSILAEAYHAVLELKGLRLTSQPEDWEEANLRRGASCIRSLRDASASICRDYDAGTVIMLGQILLAYNMLITWPRTHLIIRNVLLSVRDWYPDLAKQPGMNSVIVTPIFVDTIDCLIRREIPILQLPPRGNLSPDRFSGLCVDLLPLLYKLCKLSYHAKSISPQATPDMPAKGTDPYTEVEREVMVWSPTTPHRFFMDYSSFETAVMLAQARVYRLTTLLVIHRLRFPLGTEDSIGRLYAEKIFYELMVWKDWKNGEAIGFGANFPLLVAGLELPDKLKETTGFLEPLRFDPQHSARIIQFVDFVHQERDDGFKGIWFEQVEREIYGFTLP